MTTPPPADDRGQASAADPGPDVHVGPGRSSSGRPQAAHEVRSGARATLRGARALARGTGRASSYTVRQARRAASAEGAGDSGLARLIELHAFNAAGDAAIAISLAGTLFFQVPTGEARGQVALFLGLTMLPFAIVAPLIGPFLDRFRHGRRWAIGGTLAFRAFLAWVLASAVVTDSTWLFPEALGCLVASKAYSITRTAAVPRLLPPSVTLVKANGRISLAGVVGAGISAPIAVLASLAGSEWSLRYAFLLFVVGTILAIRLPARVDSSAGEGTLVLGSGEADLPPSASGRIRVRIPGSVAFALRANCGPRWMSGFLIMFMGFLLRDEPLGDLSAELSMGLVIGAAGVGNTLGIAVAALLKRVNPRVTVIAALAAVLVAALLAAVFYGPVTATLLGLIAGLSQSLAKLSLDSTIQRDVPERVRTSALARSDTTLQLAWVIGGFVGIALPLIPRLGLGIAAAVMALWMAFVLLVRPDQPSRRTG